MILSQEFLGERAWGACIFQYLGESLEQVLTQVEAPAGTTPYIMT